MLFLPLSAPYCPNPTRLGLIENGRTWGESNVSNEGKKLKLVRILSNHDNFKDNFKNLSKKLVAIFLMTSAILGKK